MSHGRAERFTSAGPALAAASLARPSPPAFGFARGRWAPPRIEPSLAAYDPGNDGVYRSVEPYSAFLRAYQYPAYLRGPFLAAILLLGAFGLRRGALLPWATAATLLVAPVAALDFDHRYVLPVVPVACMAAALGRATVRPGDENVVEELVPPSAGRTG